MHRSRLLLAVPAATALVLAGGSPAWAGGDRHHHEDDTWAKVVAIADEAELENGGDVLEVTFEYKCEEEEKDSVTADVVVEDEDVRYEADDVDLKCNGERNEITVELEVVKGYEEAEEGDEVDVTVTITEDDEVLDEETAEDVEVVDEENGDDEGDKHDEDEHHDHDGHGKH